MAYDTPEFLAAALAIARRSGVNPLTIMYGTNPLMLTDVRLTCTHFPLNTYKRPPPLQKITLPEGVVFEQQLHKGGNNILLTVRIGSELRLLKLVSFRLFLISMKPSDFT